MNGGDGVGYILAINQQTTGTGNGGMSGKPNASSTWNGSAGRKSGKSNTSSTWVGSTGGKSWKRIKI